jgi:hypothetical protein
MTDSVAILIRQQKVSLHHLAEFRKMMEGHISEQAAKKADKKDVQTDIRHTFFINSYNFNISVFCNYFSDLSKYCCC